MPGRTVGVRAARRARFPTRVGVFARGCFGGSIVRGVPGLDVRSVVRSVARCVARIACVAARTCFAARQIRWHGAGAAADPAVAADATGAVPVLMRAPYGVRWPGIGGVERRLGLMGVMWTVIGRDWTLDAGRIVDRVAGKLGNGSIVCLHDGPHPRIEETLEAVRRLLPMIEARGLALETVSGLLQTPEAPNNRLESNSLG